MKGDDVKPGTPGPRGYLSLWLVCTVLALVMGYTSCARAVGYPGFGLNTSRVVVMGDARGGTLVKALNNSTTVYLVQSRVVPPDGLSGFPQYQAKTKVPFIVTPPLSRMEANSQLPLRILNLPDNGLPQDRESLFFLQAKAIPSVAPQEGKVASGPRVVMAVEQYVKLFYRPAGLNPHAIFDDEVAPKLHFSKANNQLRVSNPTPYHITFGLLTVNDKSVDASALRRMVPPKGLQDYPLPAGVTGGTVAWQIIDEFGLMPGKRTQALP
ncbi:fimbrial biogenesis chaperone [Raoultella ornithinolytica]|uniref:fimbrial biogenesis chaperone n=1 Tax=Raoultella ornithinolytica TaxID=54291 RepID=UPI0021AE8F53|nr:molecular chaperone [Raoultella ornithinolytica]MCT4737215.1 molecular chaperone [Raoultella ornithinolytica]